MKAVPLRFGNTKNGSEELMGTGNYFVGVDLHRNQFMYCVRYSNGEEKVDLAVINPNQFKEISHSVKKTDKNDAKVLAEFLEKDLLPEVRMKNELQAKVASLTQTREKLVQLRTVLKNKINEDITI